MFNEKENKTALAIGCLIIFQHTLSKMICHNIAPVAILYVNIFEF